MTPALLIALPQFDILEKSVDGDGAGLLRELVQRINLTELTRRARRPPKLPHSDFNPPYLALLQESSCNFRAHIFQLQFARKRIAGV